MSESSGSLPSKDCTIFSVLPGQFPDIAQDLYQKINTQDFLNAACGVVTIVEKFGKVFAPVIHDMNGNIRKISAKFEEDKDAYKFLESMVLKLRDSNDLIAVEALMWLRRALHFITRFFQLVIDDTTNNMRSQDLSPLIKNAYRETLERYHGWLGTQLFNILSRFVPNRQQLFYHLALEKLNMEELVVKEMKIFTEKMMLCVEKLEDFYQAHDLETNNRV